MRRQASRRSRTRACDRSVRPRAGSSKARDGDTLVDLIFRPSGGAVDDEMFARATELEVMARTLPVASIDDVLATKVLALNEQTPDFRSVLEIARSLREQVDWDASGRASTTRRSAPRSSRSLERLRIAPAEEVRAAAAVG